MFTLSTREEYALLDLRLEEYLFKKVGRSSTSPNLTDAFDALDSYENSGKLLSALVDLRLTHTSLKVYWFKALVPWNETLVRHFSDNETPPPLLAALSDSELFNTKMDVWESVTSYAIRARALLDKYMGFLVLYLDPDNHENYVGAKSRKRKFVILAKSWDTFPYSIQHALVGLEQRSPYDFRFYVNQLENDLLYPDHFLPMFTQLLDVLDKYRTPEVHGQGSMRNYSLAMFAIDKSKDLNFVGGTYHAIACLMSALSGVYIDDRNGLEDYKKALRYLNPEDYV